MIEKHRFHELDSLRGLAAMTVVLSHLTSVIPNLNLLGFLNHTPLNIIWAGHEAVILFFILSGFVLSLPYYKSQQKYKDYLIKRVCRIYIPYIVAVGCAIICMNLFSRMGITELSDWFNSTWSSPVTLNSLFSHLLMLGDFQTNQFLNVIWSLIHELRISIIFPFLIYSVIKLSFKKNIVLALGCSVLYTMIWIFCSIFLDINISASDAPYALTIHYIGFFAVGALLAKHRSSLTVYYHNLSRLVKVALLLAGVMSYTYSSWFFPNVWYFHFSVIGDWAVAFGSAIFIVFSLNSPVIKSIMLRKWVHFTGQISYSLYLFHLVVLLSMVNVFYGTMPLPIVLAASFVLSIVVAGIMYYIIEKPSIKLGRYLIGQTSNAAQRTSGGQAA